MLSTTDLSGGAGIAAFRLMVGLAKIGVNAELFVQDKQSQHPAVFDSRSWCCRLLGKVYPFLDPLAKLLYRNRHRGAWSCGFLPNPCLPAKKLNGADIVHLHWINGGFLPVRELRNLRRPIVWTLHDSWPFTGGCHIPYECDRYRQLCGDCPQLRSHREVDLSSRILRNKLRNWQNVNMTIVSPSRWLAELAASSTLFRGRSIEVIPNGLDLDVFAPLDQGAARSRLGLPGDVQLVLFSAFGGIGNWNKGGDLLRSSLNLLCQMKSGPDIVVLLAGFDMPPAPDYFPVPFINFGIVRDDVRMRLLYAAADLTAIPSRSESLGYVAMESMACGTPCVSFSVGGIPDVIDHYENGYLAEAFSVQDFAAGMNWILDNDANRRMLSQRGRQKIQERFEDLTVARRYELLYDRILKEIRCDISPRLPLVS